MPFPSAGVPAAEILSRLEALAANDVDWKHGRAFTLAYYAGEDVHQLATDAFDRFLSTNALNVGAFPSLRRMQADVVSMIADLLHGDAETAGFMTTGGTESILLAVEAARGRGTARGIRSPEMVLPTSAHAAFEKAAHYFGVKSVRVPVRDDFRADATAMENSVTNNTVLLVASTPTYPHGVIDPVQEIAALAKARDLNCHVDACMGGITLPMLERLGYSIPLFDFRVPGVTSISVDLHKYGYTAKGASVILHRNKELRRHQTFSTENWLGGTYASSGMMGTRSGGPIAAAWAVLNHLGENGYLALTKAARKATEELIVGLRAIEDVEVLGTPEATVLAFTVDDANVFAVGDALYRRGWLVDQQKPPPSLHCTVSAAHASVIPEFLEALRASIREVRATQETAKQKAYGVAE